MESNEEWRPVPGYEGSYEVSNLGRVRSLERSVKTTDERIRTVPSKVLKQTANRNPGYLKVGLSRGGSVTVYRVHRLVAQVFVPGEGPGLEVCHQDGNHRNNESGNLRWGTRGDNLRDSVRHGTHWAALVTHCPQGHEYTATNTRIYRGSRFCITCARTRAREYAMRRRSAARRNG